MNEIEAKILNEYESLKPRLRLWGDYVDNALIKVVLKDMIRNNLIKILPSFRLKDNKSYLVKALYRDKNYDNPIEKIEDKVGTRIVVLKSDDIKRVSEIILEYEIWESKITKDMDQEIEDKPNIFDYQSSHIVVKPNINTIEFSEDNHNSLNCEIQIRTLLQHAFAEISHDSTYKGPYKNDKEIIRKLAKAMALMEATDDYFCNIFNMMNDEKRFFLNYSNELIRIYKNFNPNFVESELDFYLNDSIFDIWESKKVQIEDLESFVNKNNEEIQKYITPTNGLLFQQPIILLTLFYIHNHRTFLKKNWNLNLDVLKNVYKVTGTSFDSY